MTPLGNHIHLSVQYDSHRKEQLSHDMRCKMGRKNERILENRFQNGSLEGRAKLRERVAVEHTLAHIGRWQGRRARYRGLRKNLFNLRRCAVVHNLQVLARSQSLQDHLWEAE